MWKKIGSIKKYAFRYGANASINIASFMNGVSWKNKEYVATALTEVYTMNEEKNLSISSKKISDDIYQITSKISKLTEGGFETKNINVLNGASFTVTNTVRFSMYFSFNFETTGAGVHSISIDIKENDVYKKTLKIDITSAGIISQNGATREMMYDCYNISSAKISFSNVRIVGSLKVPVFTLTKIKRYYGETSPRSLNSITLITEDVDQVY